MHGETVKLKRWAVLCGPSECSGHRTTDWI